MGWPIFLSELRELSVELLLKNKVVVQLWLDITDKLEKTNNYLKFEIVKQIEVLYN